MQTSGRIRTGYLTGTNWSFKLLNMLTCNFLRLVLLISFELTARNPQLFHCRGNIR